MFGALAEFERDLIRERTPGRPGRRPRPGQGWRPRPKALDQRTAQIAQALYADKTNSIADICRTLRVGAAADGVRRAVAARR